MHRVREHFLKHNVILPEQLLAAVFREASQREDAQSVCWTLHENSKNINFSIIADRSVRIRNLEEQRFADLVHRKRHKESTDRDPVEERDRL